MSELNVGAINKDEEIKLNNGEELLEKCGEEPFSEIMPVLRLNESGISQPPHITDENINNNSTFIVNFFNLNISDDKEKSLTLSKKSEKTIN